MKSSYMPSQMTQPVLSSPPSSTVIAVQTTPAVQTTANEQLQEKIISDQQEKNLMVVAGEQRIVQHALEKNMLAMTTHFPLNVKLGNRGNVNHAWTHLSLCLTVCPLCFLDSKILIRFLDFAQCSIIVVTDSID